MSGDSKDFALRLGAFLDSYKERAEQAFKDIAFSMFREIVMRSPVDEGTFRNAWKIGVNEKPTGVDPGPDALAVLASVKIGDTVHITNNLPYGPVLEFGLYPNPPKRGSYDKNTKSYVIKSVNGFSKQAPGGFVRLTVAEYQRFVDDAAEKQRGSLR